MIISEIIDTERRYISSLETLLNTFLPALENVVAARDLRLLFPAQLEPLVERHTTLLVKLEERMSDNTLFPGIVGDIFARLLKENNVSGWCGSQTNFLRYSVNRDKNYHTYCTR